MANLNIDPTVFLAEGVRLSGDITIGEQSSVWYNAVLRASEGSRILIGERSNVQDGCVFHASNGRNITVCDNVTIGHAAIIHCCTIKANTLIGMGAIIMNDAVVGENCIIGAGALITERKVIPPGSLVFGSPAKVVRALTESEIANLQESSESYVQAAAIERAEDRDDA